MFRFIFLFLCFLLALLIILSLFGNKKAKQILLVLERLLIDIFLRRLVVNYDQRHKKRTKSNNPTGEFSKFERELGKVQKMNKELLETNRRLNLDLEEKEKEYKEKYEDKCRELDELRKTNEIFSNSIEDLRKTIQTLSYEKNQRIVNDFPIQSSLEKANKEKYLYAEPDATGTILRKISTTETKYSLFKLELLDEQVCKFSVLNNDATGMYINNRSVSLLACQIIEVASMPTKFEMVEQGTAVKNGNNWIVMEPVKIKII